MDRTHGYNTLEDALKGFIEHDTLSTSEFGSILGTGRDATKSRIELLKKYDLIKRIKNVYKPTPKFIKFIKIWLKPVKPVEPTTLEGATTKNDTKQKNKGIPHEVVGLVGSTDSDTDKSFGICDCCSGLTDTIKVDVKGEGKEICEKCHKKEFGQQTKKNLKIQF